MDDNKLPRPRLGSFDYGVGGIYFNLRFEVILVAYEVEDVLTWFLELTIPVLSADQISGPYAPERGR